MNVKEIKKMQLDRRRSVIFDLDTTPIESTGTDRVRQARLTAMYLVSAIAMIAACSVFVALVWISAVVVMSQ
jgi:hypothetical protein|tara:strand:- start:198 stop:413 length:216 start_codon:yes stop_codon:yes gene_type:complete